MQISYIDLLLREVEKAGGSQAEAAKRLGISAAYLHDMLNGRRTPGKKVLRKLKLKRVVSFESL